MSDATPNILLLMTDEQRFDHLGATNPSVKTPHLDALAANGVLFTRAYTASPSCVPARAALMTGKPPSYCGAPTYVTYLPDHEVTFMRRLHDAGYHTAVVGKQHFGETGIDKGYAYEEIIDAHLAPADLRSRRGENAWFEFLAERGVDGIGDLVEPLFAHVQRWKADPDLHVDNFVGSRALRWLRDDRPVDRPWFFCASFPGPHQPIDALGLPEQDLYDPASIDMPHTSAGDLEGKPPHHRSTHGTTPPGELTEEQVRTARLGYYANVSLIDRWVGRIVDFLKREELYDDTLILFTSDHGTFLGDFGRLGKAQYVSEVLMRIPLIVKPPRGGVMGKRESALVSLLDVAPTCLAAAGVTPLDDLGGRDLSPYWHDARDLDDRETLYMEAGDIRCVRRGDWKLAHYAGRDYGELYDLAADPWERRNLWDDPACREVRDDLRLRLLDEIIRVGPRAASPWNDRADPPSPEI